MSIGFILLDTSSTASKQQWTDVELEAHDPEFHTRQGISTSVSQSRRVMQFAHWIAGAVIWFPATVSMSKGNKETDSVKYLKGDIINNELLANVEIN